MKHEAQGPVITMPVAPTMASAGRLPSKSFSVGRLVGQRFGRTHATPEEHRFLEDGLTDGSWYLEPMDFLQSCAPIRVFLLQENPSTVLASGIDLNEYARGFARGTLETPIPSDDEFIRCHVAPAMIRTGQPGEAGLLVNRHRQRMWELMRSIRAANPVGVLVESYGAVRNLDTKGLIERFYSREGAKSGCYPGASNGTYFAVTSAEEANALAGVNVANRLEIGGKSKWWKWLVWDFRGRVTPVLMSRPRGRRLTALRCSSEFVVLGGLEHDGANG